MRTLAYDSVQRAEEERFSANQPHIGTDREVLDIGQPECLFGYNLHLVAQNQRVDIRAHEGHVIDGFDIVAKGYLVESALVVERHLFDMRHGVGRAGYGIRHRVGNNQCAVIHAYTATDVFQNICRSVT